MKANSDLRLFSLVHRPVITASLVMGEPSRGTRRESLVGRPDSNLLKSVPIFAL